jgi:hypothetical protein
LWLDSAPFNAVPSLGADVKPRFLNLGTVLATTGQRDSFAEDPEKSICLLCKELSLACENLVQNSTESLLIQPASVEVVTVKKRMSDPSIKLVRCSVLPFRSGRGIKTLFWFHCHVAFMFATVKDYVFLLSKYCVIHVPCAIAYGHGMDNSIET